MKILADLLSTLNMDTSVRDVRQEPFQMAVLTQNCGLASTPHYGGSHHRGTPPVSETGLLLEKDAVTLARLTKSQSLHEAAIGMATINSQIDNDEIRCVKLNAGDLIAEKGRVTRGELIQHFGVKETVLQAQLATLRHCELVKGRKRATGFV